MNSFINSNQQVVNGGAQFNPYMWPQTTRFPTYTATPIHGENAAWQFPMGANSEIYLPDANQDIIWWIRTDATGTRQVTAFDITLHQEPTPVDMNDVLARLSALEDKLNAKPNKSNAKRNSAAVDTTATIE